MIPLLVSNSGIVRMTKSKFSNKSIVNLPPGENHTGVKGLSVFVTPDKQRRSWILRFTSPVTHRVTTHTIGPWPAISFDDALIKLATLRKMIAHGICPVQARSRVGEQTSEPDNAGYGGERTEASMGQTSEASTARFGDDRARLQLRASQEAVLW
jgi:hypothetical protein